MDLEQRKEPRYQLTYHTYLASRGRLSYTPSVERVVGLKYVKRRLQNFTIFRLRHAHVRKDTRLSNGFSVLQATESWAGPGNEASVKPKVNQLIVILSSS